MNCNNNSQLRLEVAVLSFRAGLSNCFPLGPHWSLASKNDDMGEEVVIVSDDLAR